MSYFPLKKFFDKYFYADDIAEILKNMGETPTSKKDNDIELLIKEWPRHGNNYYDFLEMLKTPELREICKKYSIDSKGDKQKMIKRIKKEKLFEDSNKKLKITGGVGLVALFLFVLALYGAGVDTIDLVNYFITEETDVDLECVSGEFGLTIVNCELGFEITRPSLNWLKDTGNNLFYIPEGLLSNTDSKVLGGIIIGKKGSASLEIKVFQVIQMTEKNFENFANKFHEELKDTYPTYEHRDPFIVGDNAIFEMTGKMDSGSEHIWKYQLEIHNDKIYVFIEDIRIDRSNVEETYSEFKQMYNSFTYTK